MTDDPSIDAMALAKSRLEELTDRVQELEKALTRICTQFPTDDDLTAAGWSTTEINAACDAYDIARAVLSKGATRA